MLVEPGKSFAQVATTVADNGISPGVASFFTGIAISMYCPQMMGSIGNGTFLNMLQDNQGLSGMLHDDQGLSGMRRTARMRRAVSQDRLGPAAPSRAGPLGWTCGTSESDP